MSSCLFGRAEVSQSISIERRSFKAYVSLETDKQNAIAIDVTDERWTIWQLLTEIS